MLILFRYIAGASSAAIPILSIIFMFVYSKENYLSVRKMLGRQIMILTIVVLFSVSVYAVLL